MGIFSFSEKGNRRFNTHKNTKIEDLWVFSLSARKTSSISIPIKTRKLKIYGYSKKFFRKFSGAKKHLENIINMEPGNLVNTGLSRS